MRFIGMTRLQFLGQQSAIWRARRYPSLRQHDRAPIDRLDSHSVEFGLRGVSAILTVVLW
jgi:hypothetical protein